MSGTGGNPVDDNISSYLDPEMYWSSGAVSTAGDESLDGLDGYGANPDAYHYAEFSPYGRSPTDYPRHGHYPYQTMPGFPRPESERSVDSTTHSASAGSDNFRHYCPPSTAPYAASDGASSWVGPEDEEKRRRNTAASARFRVKKKQREQALETSVKQMGQKLVELEDTVQSLETENKWLRDLVTEKNRVSAEGSSSSSHSRKEGKKSKK